VTASSQTVVAGKNSENRGRLPGECDEVKWQRVTNVTECDKQVTIPSQSFLCGEAANEADLLRSAA